MANRVSITNKAEFESAISTQKEIGREQYHNYLKTKTKMKNQNEQLLLSYLEEQRTTTQSLLTSEHSTVWYWKSGNHYLDSVFKSLTNGQVDFFIENSENRIKELRFRLEWLDTQISKIK